MGKDEKLINILNQNRNRIVSDEEFKNFTKEWDEIEKYHSNKEDSSKRIINVIDRRKKPIDVKETEISVRNPDKELIEKLNRNSKDKRNNQKSEKSYFISENEEDFVKNTLQKSKEIMENVEEKYDEAIFDDKTNTLKEILKLLVEISLKLNSIKNLMIEK